ncbi:universal stress protein [Cochlodiniinecator piscidefendens]|uniref:universal stress protein n=1 Tax=Cochlodiniinecator piscidefendens TaxID=2715756 RepID=UPI00140A3606|nr:universal stress protein [Cochlodiniinecator piscidefendens]
MSIKSILCAYSGDPSKGSGLRHAGRLAKRHGAHLTGVAKRGGIGFLHRQLPAHLPGQVIAQLDANGQKTMADTKARFLEMAVEEGLGDRAEFVELDPKANGPIASFARTFDLVVIGHHLGAVYEDDYASNPDLIALRSGRPVLVVPERHEVPESSVADVLVAWDGKRAATCAVAAAMPILKQGAKVALLSVSRTPRNTDWLVQTLSKHRVVATAVTVDQNGSVAETVLAYSKSKEVNLIVMGAFEHSKFSHDIVGGATTDVLRETQVPVLLAH